MMKQAADPHQEMEALLEAVVARFADRAQDAQLPLHILLSSPFGALNENQEEMLGAALAAVDAIDVEVRQLRKLLQLHRGELSIAPRPIGVAELLRPPLAIAAARADGAHVQLRPALSGMAPRAVVDAVHAQEALTSILTDAIAQTGENGEVDVDAREGADGRIHIGITRHRMTIPEAGAQADGMGALEMSLARRLLEAQGGVITDDGERTIIELPSEAASHVAR